jgi:hypothetical protein
MTDDLVKRLRDPTFGTETTERNLMSAAADHIEELDAKLAKAVQALEKVQAFVRDLEPYADQGHTLVPALHDACAILADLKGTQ